MADNEPNLAGTSGTMVAERVGAVIDDVQNVLKAERFDALSQRLTNGGHWALLLTAVVGLLIQLVAATQFGGGEILWGIGWLVMLPLLQYVAMQFMDATRSMVTANTTHLSSDAFLRCFALVAIVAALGSLITAFVQGVELASFRVFLSGLDVTALWVAAAWLALNPSLLGIRVSRQSSASEEAIGVLSFFMKSLVRIVPIFYGVTMIVVLVLGVVLLLGMIGDESAAIAVAVTRAQFAAPVVMTAVLAPFAAYVAFALYFLVIDMMRGLLTIPKAVGGNNGAGSGSGGSRSGGRSRGGRSGGGGSRSGGGGGAASKKTASKKKAAAKKTASASGGGTGGESSGEAIT
jgi:hypothetical protein